MAQERAHSLKIGRSWSIGSGMIGRAGGAGAILMCAVVAGVVREQLLDA